MELHHDLAVVEWLRYRWWGKSYLMSLFGNFPTMSVFNHIIMPTGIGECPSSIWLKLIDRCCWGKMTLSSMIMLHSFCKRSHSLKLIFSCPSEFLEDSRYFHWRSVCAYLAKKKHDVRGDGQSLPLFASKGCRVLSSMCDRGYQYENKTSWWFQPIWKILVKLDHFPK